jgi:prepilin-type N-terminal cleavage/methylation domain-containing protein
VRRQSTERGLTLIEIMIVIALIGAILWIFGPGLNMVTKGDLRQDAQRVAAALRTASARAGATATHFRLVLDLDKDTFALEQCEGKVHMVRSVDEAQAAEAQAQLALAEQVAALQRQKVESSQASAMAGATPSMADETAQLDKALRDAEEAMGSMGSSLAPIPCKAVRLADPTGLPGLNTAKGISFKQVWVGHLEEPVTDGKVTVNFLPLGRGERAVIQLQDESRNVYSLRLHGLTGRVEITDKEIERPDDIVAGGDEVTR